jgi:class 3 adenylate cyclase
MSGKRSYEELAAITARLEREAAHHLVTQQQLIRAKGKTERELMRFRVIQEYTTRALSLSDEAALSALTLEVIIEAFELEVALLLRFDTRAGSLAVKAQFGFDACCERLPFSSEWLDDRQCIIVEGDHPIISGWHELGFAHLILGKFADKDGRCAGMIAAGITQARCDFYEPIDKAIVPAFSLMVRQAGAMWITQKFNEQIRSQNQRLITLTESYSRFVPFDFLRLLGHTSIEEVKAGDYALLEMSVLFADIRDSASLGERFDAATSFITLNEFFVAMEPVIRNHGGLQYLGDAIMALFARNADHADAALRCAAAMAQRARSLNADRASRGDEALQFGMGVSSGQLMLGAIGGGHRLDSNVIGDPANLASRTEALTKRYGAIALFTDRTLVLLAEPAQHRFREIDRVTVKGRQEPTSLYELLDAEPEPVQQQKLGTLDNFRRGLVSFRAGDLDAAFRNFDDCAAQAPGDAIAQFYLERCRRSLSSANASSPVLSR